MLLHSPYPRPPPPSPLCRKAKLFAFTEAMLDKGTGNKQWNEKGVGDVKILKCVSCFRQAFFSNHLVNLLLVGASPPLQAS